jgi:hypothetical protein
LVAFSPDDGAALTKTEIGEPLFIAPIVANRTMYLATDEGSLIALR